MSHKLTLTYDEETGRLSVEHRTLTKIGEHIVSHAEPVELANCDEAARWLKGVIDANRDEMESRTQTMALQHVAAIQGKVPPKTTALKFTGSVGGTGSVDPKKG